MPRLFIKQAVHRMNDAPDASATCGMRTFQPSAAVRVHDMWCAGTEMGFKFWCTKIGAQSQSGHHGNACSEITEMLSQGSVSLETCYADRMPGCDESRREACDRHLHAAVRQSG